MQPLSQAVLLEAFPPHERGKAMGFWGLGIVVAPILGPVLGGWLTDTYSWRWVFYINLPVGIASLVMTQLYVFDPPYLRQEISKIDYWGIGLLARVDRLAADRARPGAGARLVLVAVHHRAGRHVGGRRRRVHRARVDRAASRSSISASSRIRTYSTGVFLMTTLGFVLYGSLVLLPIMLQTLLGYPSLQAGIAMAPRGMGSLHRHADGRPADRQDRRAQDGGDRADRRRVHADLARAAESQRRLLGHLLAAVLPGARAVGAVRAADDDQHGSDPARADGQRDQPVQPDAQSRRQRRHRGDRHAAGAQRRRRTSTSSARTWTPTRRPRSARSRRREAGSSRAAPTPVTATQRAYAALFGMVQQQASMVSFVGLFRLLGVIFLLLLPLVLLMKRPRGGGPMAAH